MLKVKTYRKSLSNAIIALLLILGIVQFIKGFEIVSPKKTDNSDLLPTPTPNYKYSREMTPEEIDELNCYINEYLCKPTPTPVKKPNMPPTPSKGKISLAKEIINTFPEHPEIALAIMLQESNLNPKATGYNCFYDQDGIVHKNRVPGSYSTHCKPNDRVYAWSVDCGITQINHIGKFCPDQLLDVAHSLSRAKNKYVSAKNTFRPWVAYTSKKYLQKLPEAKLLIASVE